MNIATVIQQNELQFDRYLGQTLTLPHSGFDNIRIHPNDTAIASVINLSFKKLHENFLYLYKSSRVASNIIPVSQIAIAGVSAAATDFKWYMYNKGLSSSEFDSLENAGLYGQDEISAMIVSENIPEKSFSIFTSTGPDLVIYNNSSIFLTVPIDAIATITVVLSTQEIYPDADVKWKKITDFAFTDDYSLFVVDMSANRLVKYDATGFYTDNNILKNKLVYEDSLGGVGSINDNYLFNQPYSVDVYGDCVYVLDSGNYSVKKFDKNLNWISTYRQVRDFLSAFPVHLSHDNDGNMYVLTQKNLIYKYDNNFQNKTIIPLDSLSANNETYLKLEFSPSDKNIFYVISDKNIYKKLITTPDEDVGKYLPYIFRTDTEETYTAFSTLKGDDGDFNYVFSKSPNGAGKITIWYDNINLFDVLSVNDFDIYTLDEIKINNEEYLQNWVFNKAIAKLLLNHMRFRDQITGRFIAKRDSKNNITFRGTRYFLPNELERLIFDQDTTNYIGMNEIFQNNIVNRCLERIYNIQVLLHEALTAEIQSGFDSADIVFLD